MPDDLQAVDAALQRYQRASKARRESIARRYGWPAVEALRWRLDGNQGAREDGHHPECTAPEHDCVCGWSLLVKLSKELPEP